MSNDFLSTPQTTAPAHHHRGHGHGHGKAVKDAAAKGISHDELVGALGAAMKKSGTARPPLGQMVDVEA